MKFKAFVIRLFVFVALLIVFDQVVGWGIRKLYSSAGDKFARENFIRNDMKADVVLLGSSKCAHQYVPQIISDSLGMSVHNCGQRGNGIIYSYGRLQTIYERYTPKIVVVDLVEGYDISKNDNSRYLATLKMDYGTNADVDSLFYEVDPNSKFKMWCQSYRYNSMICDLLVNILLHGKSRFQNDGYSPLKGVMRKKPKASSVDELKKRIDVDPLKLKCLKNIAQRKDDNCTVVFVISPCFIGVNPNFKKLVKEIADENDIVLLDYSTTEGISGHKELFKDTAHLNEAGSVKFSSMVAHDLNMLQKQQNAE